MSGPREKIIVILTVLAPLTIAAGWTESVVLFSTLISVFLGFAFALGYAEHLGRWPIALTLLVVYGGLAGLWVAAEHFHDPDGPVRIVWGLPIQTMIFVWIIWPLGGAMGLLHAATFDKYLLPREAVDKVIALAEKQTD